VFDAFRDVCLLKPRESSAAGKGLPIVPEDFLAVLGRALVKDNQGGIAVAFHPSPDQFWLPSATTFESTTNPLLWTHSGYEQTWMRRYPLAEAFPATPGGFVLAQDDADIDAVADAALQRINQGLKPRYVLVRVGECIASGYRVFLWRS